MPRKNILVCCLFSYLWFFTLLVFAQEIPYPYEKCNWENRDFTNRIVRESQDFSSHKTEAQATCLSCHKKQSFQKNHLNGTQWALNQAMDVPEICFLAGALSKKQPTKYSKSWYYCPGARSGFMRPKMRFTGSDCSRSQYSSCTLDEEQGEHFFDNFQKDVDAQKRPWTLAQRPCLSKDYVRMTAKAFNETANCFGFNSKEDKEQLFALMHHQSAFLLNKKAENKTAGCYGQISNRHIADINSYIHAPKYAKNPKHVERYHQIYQNVVKKCPHITSKVSLLNQCQESSKDIFKYRRCLMQKSNSDFLMCQTSQDPYSCLFYTLYGIKKNELNMESELASHKDIKELTYSEIGKHFKWPVKINEMLIVKGNVRVDDDGIGNISRKIDSNAFVEDLKYVSGTKDTFSVNSVYKNSTPVIEAFSKPMFTSLFHLTFNSKDIKAQKVKIFDEHKLKWAFLHLAHSKGISIISSHFAPFMQHMKGRILEEESYKNDILNGKSLDLSVLVKEFDTYAKSYQMVGQPPGDFIHKVSQSLHNLTNKNKQLGENIQEIYTFQDFNPREINAFTRLVEEHCPTTLL